MIPHFLGILLTITDRNAESNQFHCATLLRLSISSCETFTAIIQNTFPFKAYYTVCVQNIFYFIAYNSLLYVLARFHRSQYNQKPNVHAILATKSQIEPNVDCCE